MATKIVWRVPTTCGTQWAKLSHTSMPWLLSSSLHMSLRVRSDKPLICLDRNFRWRLPRQLGTGMEGAKTRRGEETAQDPRAKTLIQLWFQAAAYRTGPRTGRAKSSLEAALWLQPAGAAFRSEAELSLTAPDARWSGWRRSAPGGGPLR